MHRPFALIAVIVFAGCSSEPARPAPPPPASPAAPAAPTDEDDGAIVLRGSHDEPAAAPKERTPEEQARIDALEAAAADSQGKDHGKPYREKTGAAPAPGKAPAKTLKPGRKAAPALTVSWVNGSGFDLSSVSGQVVVLEFWRASNRPSRVELTELQRIASNYPAGKVAFAAIHTTRGAETAASTASAQGIGFPIGIDVDDKTVVAYGATSVPLFVLIDKKGGIVKTQRQCPVKGAIDALVAEE